ncbi:MAG: SprT family zinc-dependent metalloprotease [Chloroflexi bacterium]|nr:SprT family zinc-dependent metalloprotease [Chloroflexota bacterium]
MPIPIDHLIHTRRKTVALVIQRDGTLTVRAPQRMSDVHIHEFVKNHADWIREKQAQAKASPPPPQKHFIEGETFLYLGKEYPLTIVAHQRSALTISSHMFQLAISYLPRARQAFIRWYKAQALMVISERVAFHAKQNKFTYQKIRISSARTRWGSCSTNGTLSFTWRLVLAPLEIVDYVVLHELLHTQIRNHSKTFWQKMGEILPEYKKRIRWLKQNGKYITLQEKTA